MNITENTLGFSNGWLGEFKTKNYLNKQKIHEKANDASLSILGDTKLIFYIIFPSPLLISKILSKKKHIYSLIKLRVSDYMINQSKYHIFSKINKVIYDR